MDGKALIQMKIVILVQFFWPEPPDYKCHVIAAELARRGHDVTVITTFPNYPDGRIYDGYQQSWRSWEYKDGYKILRVPIYPDHSHSSLRRALCYLSFTFSASTIGFLLGRKADVLFDSCSPITIGLTAYLYKFFYKSRIIMNVEDLWPDTITASGLGAPALYAKICGRIAEASYRVAQLINVHSNGFKNALTQRGVATEKITVTPVWANRETFYEAVPDKEFGKKYDLTGKFCIVYVGNIGLMQNIANVLAVAAQLQGLPRLRFVLVGSGNELGKLQQQAKKMHLTNVIIAGYYPIQRVAGILAWGDALLVSLKGGEYLSMNFPSKISGYMAAGKPILACADGEARHIVEKFANGMSCCPDDPNALAELIKKFMETPEQERIDMGKRSREAFEQFYDKDVIVKKYIEMIEKI